MSATLANVALAAIPEGLRYFTARKQLKQAQKIRANTTRSQYEIPGAVNTNVQLAKNRMASDMPGMDYLTNTTLNNAANSTFDAAQSGQSPAATMATIAAINDNTNRSVAEIGYKNAMYKDSRRQIYMNANERLADELRRKWDYDVRQKYDEAMAAASALENAGGVNQYNAVSGLAKSAMLAFDGTNKNGGAYGPAAPPLSGNTTTSDSNTQDLFNQFKAYNPELSDDQIMELILKGVQDPSTVGLFL